MLNLKKILKPYTETGALNEQVNLYGFVDPHAFLTKSGDVGVILQVHGVDYECLDGNALDTLTKRLESALSPLRQQLPHLPVPVQAESGSNPAQEVCEPHRQHSHRNRIRYFAQKSDNLYSLQSFLRCPLRGLRHKQALLKSLAEFHKNPKKALEES